MKKTSLYNIHQELGAKMVPFAGFEMPVYYSGIVDEHLAVRKQAGLFDISHMGEFFVKGKGASDLLQYVTANDIDKLAPGKVQYTYLPNEDGGIVDDLVIYQFGENDYMLVVNAANIEKDWNWIQKYNKKYRAEMENRSDSMALLALQGPESRAVMHKLAGEDVTGLRFYTFTRATIAGVPDVIVSATGYTGSAGFELYCADKDAPVLWDAIMKAGKDHGVMPAGLGARDTLRLEAGLLLYGNDMDDHTSPYSVRLGWVTKPEKPFVGRDLILKQKENGISRRLVGLETDEKIVPRQGYPVLDTEDGTEIGVITSGTRSPLLNKAIALASLKAEYAKPGSEVFVRIRKKVIKTKVAKLPFYKENSS